MKQLYNLIIKNEDSHFLKNNYLLVKILKNIKNVKNLVTLDFTDLFNNNDLSDLNNVINSHFKKYKNQLNLPHNVGAKYFQTSTNFIIRNNHLLQDSKVYLQKEGIPQGSCDSD